MYLFAVLLAELSINVPMNSATWQGYKFLGGLLHAETPSKAPNMRLLACATCQRMRLPVVCGDLAGCSTPLGPLPHCSCGCAHI